MRQSKSIQNRKTISFHENELNLSDIYDTIKATNEIIIGKKIMDKDNAKELLSFHSSRNSDVHNPKWKNGFLGSLRPFCGELREENFVEVMECLKALKDEFSSAAIEKEIIADIIAITYLAREWAAPDGMLGS